MECVIVRACRRAAAGGSPTAVLAAGAAPPGGPQRRRLPGRLGVSHVVLIDAGEVPVGEALAADRPVGLRFYTAAGELPACGHGTVAALAYLAARAGVPALRTSLRIAGRTLDGHVADGHAWFTEPGVVLLEPDHREVGQVLPLLGLPATTAGVRAASTGRRRLLVPVGSRRALAELTPDLDALGAACERLGLLGCYVHTQPDRGGRPAARMFAPAIGVPEDVANANSTACLAAALAEQGHRELAVDMGDALGSPATIRTIARPDGVIEVGGEATVTGTIHLD